MSRRSARNNKSAEKAQKYTEIDEDDAEAEEPPKKKSKPTAIKKPKETKEKSKPTAVKKQKETKTKQDDEGTKPDDKEWQNASSIHDFTVKDINGKEVPLEKYKGHVCIIVNVASRCGHTKSNYEQLVELYEKYGDERSLKILAFPCNQFGKQEPGDSAKICEFVKKRNVTFDMFEKIDVNGKNAHPLWTFMKEKIAGPKGKNIDWNFTKFIVNKEGEVIERHKPTVKPLALVESLEKLW